MKRLGAGSRGKDGEKAAKEYGGRRGVGGKDERNRQRIEGTVGREGGMVVSVCVDTHVHMHVCGCK